MIGQGTNRNMATTVKQPAAGLEELFKQPAAVKEGVNIPYGACSQHTMENHQLSYEQ